MAASASGCSAVHVVVPVIREKKRKGTNMEKGDPHALLQRSILGSGQQSTWLAFQLN
jgi:hypothetical protein